MAARNYSNTAIATTVQTGIDSTVTALVVAAATGYPAAPFVILVDRDEASEELILVGAKSGTNFTSLTRGFGGTSGAAHSAGASVELVAIAEDLALVWSHVHSGSGGDDTAVVSHDDLDDVSEDDHHAKDHTVASHTDTSATGAELNALTDGSDAAALHDHSDKSDTTHDHDDDYSPLNSVIYADVDIDISLAAVTPSVWTAGAQVTFTLPNDWTTARVIIEAYVQHNQPGVKARIVTSNHGNSSEFDHSVVASVADEAPHPIYKITANDDDTFTVQHQASGGSYLYSWIKFTAYRLS